MAVGRGQCCCLWPSEVLKEVEGGMKLETGALRVEGGGVACPGFPGRTFPGFGMPSTIWRAFTQTHFKLSLQTV